MSSASSNKYNYYTKEIVILGLQKSAWLKLIVSDLVN